MPILCVSAQPHLGIIHTITLHALVLCGLFIVNSPQHTSKMHVCCHTEQHMTFHGVIKIQEHYWETIVTLQWKMAYFLGGFADILLVKIDELKQVAPFSVQLGYVDLC